MLLYLRKFYQIIKDRRLQPVLAAALFMIVVLVLSGFPSLVESIYSRGVYFGLTGILSSVSAALPFSLSELSLYLAIAALLIVLVRGFRRRQILRAITTILRAAAVILIWFYVSWGLNYFRQPLAEQLRMQEVKAPVDTSLVRKHLQWSIDATNERWQQVTPWKLNELNQEIETSYRQLFQRIDLPLAPGERRPKFPIFPGLFNYTLTSGMFGPLFHEIHLNAALLPQELPFVLAHEKAHQLGIARESEANFLAALVCLSSANPAIQYAGHFSLLGRFLNRGIILSDYKAIAGQVRPEVRADFKAVRERYAQYVGTVSEMTQKSYDLYLKANKIQEGIKNYGGVVGLMISWREQHQWPQ